MVLKLCVACQYVTSGMFVEAQFCVCVGIEEDSAIRVHLRFIYPAVWRKKIMQQGRELHERLVQSVSTPCREFWRANSEVSDVL